MDARPPQRFEGRWPSARLGLTSAASLLLTACSQVNLLTPEHASTLSVAGDICALHPASATASLSLLLAAGFMTGLSHCVGMCGPLVTAFTMRQRVAGGDRVTALVTYQMGRLTTYLLLGTLAGAIGSVVRVTSVDNGWQGALSVLMGGLMLLAGLSLWGVLPWLRWLESTGFAGRIASWMRVLINTSHPAAPFGLGITNGLLPCGPVYAMALVAATSGAPIRGATIMFLFGLGTLPAMLGVTLLTSRLTLGLRRNLYRFAAALVMVVGLQLLLRGLAVGGLVPHTAVAGVALW